MPDVFDLGQSTTPPYRFITDSDDAQSALHSLHLETIIGLDTETYWNVAANRSHVSLLQIAPREGVVLVFDLLMIEVELFRPC